MSTESQEPLLIFLPPDLRAQMSGQDAWEPARELSPQEISDNAFASYGRMLLAFDHLHNIKNPDFEDLYPRPASLEDWENLEAEDPDTHHRLSKKAFEELARQGIDAPFTPLLAEIHSLDEARAKREEAQPAQPEGLQVGDRSGVS